MVAFELNKPATTICYSFLNYDFISSVDAEKKFTKPTSALNDVCISDFARIIFRNTERRWMHWIWKETEKKIKTCF